MGKRIKSTGVILDASSMASAPVSPAGTVALRAKSDATQFQYSANGGAWTDFGSGGGGGFPRLDQVLDPGMAAPPTTTQIKTFTMSTHQLVFHFAGTEPEECFVIESLSPGDPPASGSVLLLRASGSATQKAPLRIEGRGAFYFTVNPDGKVAIGTESGLANKLTIEHINTGGTEIGGIQTSVILSSGNTASSISTGVFTLSDAGNTTALTEARLLNLSLSRSSAAVSNASLYAFLIDARATFSANTGVCYGLFLKPTMSNAATLTHWVGIHVETPALLAGGAITNTKAIITAPGAGNVGIGTLTPAAQLHVSGTVQVDQTTTQAITLYKYTDTTDPFTIDIKRAHGTSSGTAANIVTGDIVGRMLFEGRLAGAYTQLGYLQTRYDSTYIGVVELGAGAYSLSRVELVESGSVGAVSLRANGGNYFQVQTSGFIFSHGSTGATYYKDSGGWFAALAIGTVSQVLTVTDIGGGVLQPRWGAAPGGGSAPGGSASELQYRAGASTFGAVTSSSVSGANLGLGGDITFTRSNAVTTIQIDRTGSDLVDGNEIGFFRFRGNRSGVMTLTGYLRSHWADAEGGQLIEIGQSTTSRIGVSTTAATMLVGSHYVQVQSGGVRLSPGSAGAIWYQGATFITPLTIGGSGTFLKSNGSVPSWAAINAGTDITAGTLPLARGGTGSSLTDPGADRILFWDDSAGVVDWLTAGSGLTITGTTMTATGTTAPAGSGSELQYRNAGAFGAVTSSSVDGSGVITIGAGSTIWKSDSSVLLSLRQYESTAANAPQISILRSRGSESSKSAVLAGDALFVMPVYGQYDSAAQRMGGQLGFTATGNYSTSSAPTVFRLKTTHLNQNFPMERLVIGGSKSLVDNTLTDLFTITFAAADQVGLGGEIHMMFIAKQVAGTVHTQVYRRVVSFIIGHNGATNTSMANFREEAGGQASAASNTTGFGGLSHAINADAAVSIGTNIPASPNVIATNTITYRILADSDLTTISQMTVYYHIIYHGEAEVTLS